MSEPINIQDMIDGRLDIKSLGEAANGDENTQVITRLGETYPSAKKAIKQMFENGALPATPFATKALMTASALIDGKYAMVTDDTVVSNNGLYLKAAGAWVKSAYDISQIVPTVEKLGLAKHTSDRNDISATLLPDVAWSTSAFSASQLGKFSLLYDVTGGEVVTLYVVRSPASSIVFPRLGFWRKAPDDWRTYNIPDVFLGFGTLTGVTDVAGKGWYVTFTVPADMTKMVYDTRMYDKRFWANGVIEPNVVLMPGAYNVDLWDSIKSTSIFENKVRIRSLEVDQISSPEFRVNKNLFKGYDYGTYTNRSAVIGTPVTNIRTIIFNPEHAEYKRIVSCQIAVKPNTKYTISKEPSDRFAVAIGDANFAGKLLLRDASKRSFTFTTEADTAWVYIELSIAWKTPLVQIEKGDKVTNYMPYKKTLSDTSTPWVGKLTEDLPLPENIYNDIINPTDKFGYPFGSPEYQESDYINEYYEPLLAKYPQVVSKSVIGRDASNTYNLVKYIFSPDHYEQTIFITSGMHPTEACPPFALGALLKEAYERPERHPMLAYMRNKVRFIVIPTLNPWGMNVLAKAPPLHYTNVNGVNISRSFYNRWYRYTPRNAWDVKGTAPLTQVETLVMKAQLELHKDEIDMVFDCHTGEDWAQDAFVYWLDDDKFLKPALEQVVSMMNDKIRVEENRLPVNETMESDRTLNIYFAGRTLGIPTATIEFGTVGTYKLDSNQIAKYANQLFNYLSSALTARIGEKKAQAKINEHNKPYVSLFNFLDGHNEYIDEFVGLNTLIANGMQSVGLVGSPLVVGVESAIVKLTHTPAKFDRTVVVMAGARGQSKKDVVSLAFTAYKFMTDDNPYIVALRKRTKLVFIPALNPVGVGNKSVNNASAVPPFANFSTSTQIEAKDLRAFLDAGGIDYIVQLDAFNGTNTKPHADYALLQTISSNKYASDFDGLVENLERKYNADIDIKSSAIGDVTNPVLSDYIATKGIPFTYIYLSQNILPKRQPVGSGYVDYGYEANEMALCSEVIFNAIRDMAELLQQKKALALLGA